ncbi:MAG TPA: L-threonine 3-dehydrogenase [Acidimicrobiia bacterium]|jgi:threonine 3-dehydrogenase|nr:L-threonine 3-dehydrogenase [Acidimicrobiia bacterium]HIL47045.1 L-threonine 3-dehydrogenase [Acidimicrobiia bacterium]
MKALVKLHSEPGLWLQEVPKPQPEPHEVLIKVNLAAICGTDLHIFQWDNWAQENIDPPVTVGHEFVGTIVETGNQVTGLAIGTRVVGEGHIVCGTCRNCRAGRNHFCRATQGVGIHRNGGFAEYVTIPATNAYPIPDSISDETAAILDPLGNAVHTALSFDLVGEDVLITGAGPIGQMAAAICRHAGARHIVITDLQDRRLQTAQQMGATRTVNPTKESLSDVMSELNMAEGFDIALEMSGSPAALADLIKHTVHGGQVGLLGLFSQSATMDLNQIIFKGLTIKGIYGREMFDTWYKAVAMLNSGLDVSPVISHRFALTDYQEAFATLQSGEASKIILEIG